MLDGIMQSVRARLDAVVARSDEWEAAAARAPAPRPLAAALTVPELSVIAEIKRRSPSAGPLNLGLDPAALAHLYAVGGAAAVSVLTEPDHFGGSLDDLRDARVGAGPAVAVLRKDFIVHRAQVWHARAFGADALLLIVALLDDADLATLLVEARRAGMDALVEAHTADEADRAVAAGADIIGVNNRDLTTFTVDLGTAETVRRRIPDSVVTVAESGVSSSAGAARMAAAGYDAILVGEALVTADDPRALLAELRVTK